jgi:hypothetical protein
MGVDRRQRERRTLPGQHTDVTRLEHENLCKQMDEVLRTLRRLETELRAQAGRLSVVESAVAIGRRTAS